MSRKFFVRILGYIIGETETIIDEKVLTLEDNIESESVKLVRRAIKKNASELIIDIYPETKGAK